MTKRLRMLALPAIAALVLGAVASGGVAYWRARQVRTALYEAFTPVHITNCRLERFGSDNDGGYPMCGNLVAAAQSGYSYGIDGEDAWGCEVAAATGITVHQYDCHNTQAPSCGSGATIFHAECAGPERTVAAGKPFDTIAAHVEKNGDTGKRLIVKMDVEGAEWRTLMAAPDHVLEAIDQMAVEFHDVEQPHFLETAARLNQFFYVARVHHNNYHCQDGYDPFPGTSFEVLFVSKRLAVADPWKDARGPSSLDAPNSLTMPDCQASPAGNELQRMARWMRRQTIAAVTELRR